ncbi:MAG: NAD(P)H-dependent glycerol-3-phosphate dehydrogenase, partial [candidate division WOR-3 bacterium]
RIKIWEYDKKRAIYVQKTRDNRPFLFGYKIPKEILVDWQLENVLRDCELIVFAIPCQKLRGVLQELKKLKTKDCIFLSLIKGIEIKTLQLPSAIIKNELKIEDCYVLSGPSIANEVIRGEPTAVVLTGREKKQALRLQKALSTPNLRIYFNADLIGVEIGGAVKNVLAIACGISDGLGLGSNTKGALITRGIVEIQRLGIKMGAQPKTFWGLSGLGDLVTTSFSRESRNHQFGWMLGRGKCLAEIKKEMVMVAEGVTTVKAVIKLARIYNIEMPISQEVYEVIYKNKSPKEAIKSLMSRPLKEEG